MNRKNIIRCLVIILLSFVVAVGFFLQAPTYGKVKKILENDRDVLEEINNILLSDENSYVSWNIYEKDVIACGPNMVDAQKITVRDDFLALVEKLNPKRYHFVNKQNNYIEYRLWANMTTCVSLIYSPDSEPDIHKSDYDIVFELKRINTTDWYYHKLKTDM